MPVLSLSAEQAALQQIAAAPDSAEALAARTFLIETHLHLVVHIARYYQPCGVALADLIQEGNLALITAAHHVDPAADHQFTAVATRAVQQAVSHVVQQHLREHYLVAPDEVEVISPLPASTMYALAHNASDAEAIVLDLPEARFVSLTALLEEAERADDVCVSGLSSGAIDPEEGALAQERSSTLMACMQTLTARERLVLILRSTAHTLREIGDLLGVTSERVRQIAAKSLRKLRRRPTARLLRRLL